MNYYDITDLINHAKFSTKVSGIQRVVLEGLRNLNEADKIFFISPVTGKIFVIEELDKESLIDLTSLVNLFLFADFSVEMSTSDFKEYFEKYAGSSRKRRALSKMYTFMSKLGVFCRPINKIIKNVITKHYALEFTYKVKEILMFEGINNLILFGGVWNFQNKYKNIIDNAKQEGGEVVFMVYDMIPIVCDYVPDELKSMFSKYIPFVLKHADKIIVNSQSCKKDLESYALKHSNVLPEVDVIHLAHKLPKKLGKNSNSLLPLRTRKLSKEKFVLCVGSIESRKNHVNLLIMWKKFIESPEYANQKLVIVGRFLWDTEVLRHVINSTGYLYGTIIVIESASEDELDFLYQNCRFTVFPSHYEGWGLPLGESLSAGKPCIHFDISSLSEAGYGMTTPVKYLDYKDFYIKLSDMMVNDQFYMKEIEKIDFNKLRTWNDFSSDIAKVL